MLSTPDYVLHLLAQPDHVHQALGHLQLSAFHGSLFLLSIHPAAARRQVQICCFHEHRAHTFDAWSSFLGTDEFSSLLETILLVLFLRYVLKASAKPGQIKMEPSGMPRPRAILIRYRLAAGVVEFERPVPMPTVMFGRPARVKSNEMLLLAVGYPGRVACVPL